MSFTEIPRTAVDTVLKGRGYLDGVANKASFLLPKGSLGIGGFVFDYEGETSVVLQSDITDHYAEDNKVLNDHIAQKPTRITFRGYVSELVQTRSQGVAGLVESLQNKLTTVPAYLGKYTPQALGKVQAALTKAQATISKVDQALSRAKNIVGMFPGASPAPTQQRQKYDFVEGLMLSRQVMLVDTPFGFFRNMVIESVTVVQPEETKSWSEMSITVKEVRFAAVEDVLVNADTFAKRAAEQRSGLVQQGQTQGQDKTIAAALADAAMATKK